MNCHYHPEHPVARECRVCHHLICPECIVSVGEHAVCKSCVAETLVLDDYGLKPAAPEPRIYKGEGKAKEKADQKAVKALRQKAHALGQPIKSGFLTVLFSCLPGLGHYYLGLQKRGLNLMILFFAIIFLSSIVPNVLDFGVAIAIPILWFYAQFDALKYRALINAGADFEDQPILPQFKVYALSAYVGWGLAILGSFALFYNLLDLVGMDYRYREAIKEMVTALLLLGAGYWILKGKSFAFLSKGDNDDHKHA